MNHLRFTHPTLTQASRCRAWSAAVALALALTGCSGGTADPGSDTPVGDLNIEGTAAIGAGLKGATVTIRCSNGAGGIVEASVLTNSTDQPGHYQTLVKGAKVPCLLQVKGKDDKGMDITLFGAALAQAGSSVVANLTPLTDAMMRSALTTDDLQGVFNQASSATLALLGQFDVAKGWNVMATTLAYLDQISPEHLEMLKKSNPLAEKFLADGTGLDAILDVLAKAGVTPNQLASKVPSYMRYERLDATGAPLKPLVSTKTWSDTGSAAVGTQWDCVRDRQTGLTWEVKRPETEGPMAWRNKNHWHTWWRQVTFTSTEGTISDQPISYWNGAVESKGLGLCNTTLSACNTSAYVAKANEVGICGHRDWRLPHAVELGTLLTPPGASDPTGSMWMDRLQFPDQPEASRDNGALMVWTVDPNKLTDRFGGGSCVNAQGDSTCLYAINFSGYFPSDADRHMSTPMSWPSVVRLVRGATP